MATPVGDSHQVASGSAVVAGRHRLPAWRRGMSANTWRTIPAANRLSDLNPANDPAINPNYPGSPEWGEGVVGSISAWCGAAYDRATDTLWLPLQGGHQDGAGNQPYKIRVSVDTPSFVMLRKPSGAIGNLLTTNDGQEASGVYADGRPRAVHSYNKPIYAPGTGPMLAIQGSSCAWGANGGTGKPIVINEVSGEATFKAENPFAALAAGGDTGGGCYDPLRNCVWWLPPRNGSAMTKYDIASNTWSEVGAGVASSSAALCYLPDDDCILVVGTLGANGFAVFDCATGTWHYPSITGVFVGGINLSVYTYGAVSPTWVPGLSAAAMWDNSSNTASINIMTKPANPRSGVWVVSQLPVSGLNVVAPSARTPNGTYGRFQYSPNLDGFLLLNAVDQDLYFYALSAA